MFKFRSVLPSFFVFLSVFASWGNPVLISVLSRTASVSVCLQNNHLSSFYSIQVRVCQALLLQASPLWKPRSSQASCGECSVLGSFFPSLQCVVSFCADFELIWSSFFC
jgi:hypothetical protein